MSQMGLREIFQVIIKIPVAIFVFAIGFFMSIAIGRNKAHQNINLEYEIDDFPIHRSDDEIYSKFCDKVNLFIKTMTEKGEATLELTISELNELSAKRRLSMKGKGPIRSGNRFKPPSFYEIVDGDTLIENIIVIPYPNNIGIRRERILTRFLNQEGRVLEENTTLEIRDYSTREFERVSFEVEEISSSKFIYMIVNYQKLLTIQEFIDLAKKIDNVSVSLDIGISIHGSGKYQ
jgi:hypothetical protein